MALAALLHKLAYRIEDRRQRLADIEQRVDQLQRQVGDLRTIASAFATDVKPAGNVVPIPNGRAFELGREVERRRWERMTGGDPQ